MFTKMYLARYERFYYNGRLLSSVCTPFNNSIRAYCRCLGFSPDCVTKRVSYKLEIDDDLPF